MGRLLVALLVGLVGAAIIHIAVVFAIPDVAENNAWAHLSRLGEPLKPVLIEASGPPAEGDAASTADAGFSFLDPAFITLACRFSLADGPVRVFATAETGFWSASIYERNGDNLYSINARVALNGRFDLLIGTSSQIDAARIEGAVESDDSIPVKLPIEEGYVTLRALVDYESNRPYVDRFVRSTRCEQVFLDDAES